MRDRINSVVYPSLPAFLKKGVTFNFIKNTYAKKHKYCFCSLYIVPWRTSLGNLDVGETCFIVIFIEFVGRAVNH